MANLAGQLVIRPLNDIAACFPNKRLSGPSVPTETLRESRSAFEASMPTIADRVGKEIAAMLRVF